ncbi:MAG: hypothetical protein PHY45_08300 [Rhodocyclaceae bacterium]|nr:hypothetical protein [Rhodocyclaceae bacterium]
MAFVMSVVAAHVARLGHADGIVGGAPIVPHAEVVKIFKTNYNRRGF